MPFGKQKHLRDKHEVGSSSTSPPPKKKRKTPNEITKDEDMEVESNEEIKDLSFRMEEMEIDNNMEEEIMSRSKMVDNKIKSKHETIERQDTVLKQKLLEEEKKKKIEKEIEAQELKEQNKKRKQKSKDDRKRKNRKSRRCEEFQNKNLNFSNLKEIPENIKQAVELCQAHI